jgi:ATP-dependent Clp protease ATP-binding subunit ClpC
MPKKQIPLISSIEAQSLGTPKILTKVRRRKRLEERKTPALDFFAVNLTDEIIQKKIDPVIGREEEIARLIQILSRRTKNNPILLGEPGVGKTAIVEGLAKKILQGQVPDILINKKIFSLDLSLLIAGTIFRGDFENRMRQVIEEIKSNSQAILFIDEIHNIIGAGSTPGSLDAANILKPALSRGEIRCIGTTTPAEYKKYIEPDPALERRFQPIYVNEPTPEETIELLSDLANIYQRYHGVIITPQAIQAAVELSERYIQDKFLPDKAIDLIDEAASKIKVKRRRSKIYFQIKAKEKELEKIKKIKLETVEKEDYQEALDYKEREMDILEELAVLEERQIQEEKVVLGEIGRAEIAEVLSEMTKIPLKDLVQEEKERLLNLEKILEKRIIGQDEAIKEVARCIRRAQVGLNNPFRPKGSFIFLGPSGVGKTELAKVMAEEIFGQREALIRIDMSEFSEPINISKLIGSPPGYVGYRESGKLTDPVKNHPYSLVLFDEIEKAHSEVLNLLLQILEDGSLTDATGRKIDFKNTIIVMTSNIGTSILNKQASIGFETRRLKEDLEAQYKETKEKVLRDLKNRFRLEFLNRVDKIIVFKPLNLKTLEKIVDLQMKDLEDRCREKGIKLKLLPGARKFIAKASFAPEVGARAIRQTIQDLVETPLAEALLKHQFNSGDCVKVDYKKGRLDLELETPKEKRRYREN